MLSLVAGTVCPYKLNRSISKRFNVGAPIEKAYQSDCCEACRKNSACIAWELNADSASSSYGLCQLKNSTETRYKKDSIAGFRNYPQCPEDAGWDQMVKFGGAHHHLELLNLIDALGFTDTLKSAARGKAVLAPTNQATLDMLDSSGFKISEYRPAQASSWNLSSEQKATLLEQLSRMIISATSFREKVLPKNPCALYAAINNIKYPLGSIVDNRLRFGRPGKASKEAMAKSSSRDSGIVTAKACPINMVSALGLTSGYDIFNGMPLLAGWSTTDPGAKGSPIFAIDANSCTAMGAAGCSQSTAESTTDSYLGLQENIATDVGIEAAADATPEFGVSFTNGKQFKAMTGANTTTNAHSVASWTKFNFQTYQLKGVQPLDSTFVSMSMNILTYADNPSSPFYSSAINAWYSRYGTHYITSVTQGGIANMFLQFSAESQAELKSMGIDIEGSLEATFGVYTGKVSGDYNQTSGQELLSKAAEKNRGYNIIPSNVNITYQDGVIDCPAWTQAIEASNTVLPPINFLLTPITEVFTADASLWYPYNVTDTQLLQLQGIIKDYFKTCATMNGCPPDFPPACNPGYYGASYESCQNCFMDPNNCPFSSGACNPHTRQGLALMVIRTTYTSVAFLAKLANAGAARMLTPQRVAAGPCAN
ncbi:hypothetical protein Ndes2437B_g05919 [Nannochloris sp. 'desiccata']